MAICGSFLVWEHLLLVVKICFILYFCSPGRAMLTVSTCSQCRYDAMLTFYSSMTQEVSPEMSEFPKMSNFKQVVFILNGILSFSLTTAGQFETIIIPTITIAISYNHHHLYHQRHQMDYH